MKKFNSRRDLLKQTLASSLGFGAFGSIQQLQSIHAAAGANSDLTGSGDYKALVCVFLQGGNDSTNTLIPIGDHDYPLYQTSRQHLAIPKQDALPISPATDTGRSFGLHPALPGLKSLFDDGNVGFVNNVGSLYAPTTRQDFLDSASHLPLYLFSHIDQAKQWMTSTAKSRSTQGWAGRVADKISSINTNTQISMNISLGGTNYFQTGEVTSPYTISPDGTIDIQFVGGDPDYHPHYNKMVDQVQADYLNVFSDEYAKIRNKSFLNHSEVSSAQSGLGDLNTVFPDRFQNSLADQLKQVAKFIRLKDILGFRRQIFFVTLNGFDTHEPQLQAHAELLTKLNEALTSFYQATEELGVQDDVVTFTASDFGRTLTTNGKGSDHGWGADHIVMGGKVKGGDLYGSYPVLEVGGPNDSIRGSWIPTTSVDEFGATLANWMGVSQTDLPSVFPNLHRFNTPDLGFMNA